MSNSLTMFLKQNKTASISPLPLVHTTKSYHIRSIIGDQKLKSTTCPFFGESLTYFFFGRPSYKPQYDYADAAFWELPTCFIFDFHCGGTLKRLYPFDTGAFHNKRMPRYINEMPLSEFELQNNRKVITKFIGAFFDTARDYLYLSNTKSEHEFMLKYKTNALDPEVLAIRRLITDSAQQNVDDRRIVLELQFDKNIDLKKYKPLAVISPEIYFQEKKFFDVIINDWNAMPLPYDMFPLNGHAYMSKIYELCLAFYKSRGFL